MSQVTHDSVKPARYAEWISSDDLAKLEQTVLAFKTASEADFATDYMYYNVERLRVLGELKAGILEDIASAEHDPNVGAAFRARFGRLRVLDDLERAIIEPRPDVDLTEEGDYTIKAFRFNTIALTFRARYEHFTEPEDLECAVAAARLAVTHTREGDEAEATHLTNLSTTLQMRFDRRGELDDLEEAIISSRKATEAGVRTDHGQNRAAQYNNLSLAYEARYNRLGALEDNGKSIAAIRQALDLVPDTDRHYAALLNCLGNGLLARYERVNQISDLEEAVNLFRKAVELATEHSSASQPGCRNNFCIALTWRFKRLGRIFDLEDAISAIRLALPGMALVYQPQGLCNLGIALTLKAQHPGVDDSNAAIDEALEVFKRSLELTPDGDTDWVEWRIYLGDAFAARYALQRQQEDLANAVGCYRQSANRTTGQPAQRFKAALAWARLSFSNEGAEASIPAYECIISLAPLLVWLGQSTEHRYEQVAHSIGDVISEAAAAAISAERLELAIEWLEAGRGIVWSQLFNLRSPVGDLRAVNAALADEFEQVTFALQSSTGHRPARDHIGDSAKSSPELSASSIEQAAKRRRDLARRYESLLEDIRTLDGFHNFLRPPRLPELRAAAIDGPVVVINVHSSRCDALVLSPAGDLRHVALTRFSQKLASVMYSAFLVELAHGGLRDRSSRAIATSQGKQGVTSRLPRILERLWSQVVEPILTSIEDMIHPSVEGRLPHLTWCATGHLAHLPIHAAGLYASSAQQHKVFNRVVSSYTPSLSALIRCQRSAVVPDTSLDKTQQVLLVTQANAPGWDPLPGTLQEARILQERFAGSATIIGEERATVSAVREAIKENAWIHLACHGVQKTTNPTESGFALYDGSLTLGALMEESTERAELAFLSACQTATGDSSLSEEAVHLAAGMLAVGFRAVVGTLWNIGDAEAPVVADAFYASLLEQRNKGEVAHGTRTGAAYALHDAVGRLREKVGEDKVLKWAPFVHFGV